MLTRWCLQQTGKESCMILILNIVLKSSMILEHLVHSGIMENAHHSASCGV